MSNASHNAFLTTFAIANAAYAVALLIAPAAFLQFFGLSAEVSGIWFARMLGCAILGLGAVSFFGRRMVDIEARRALDAGLLVSTASGLGVSLWAQYIGAFNNAGWINVGVLGVLSVGLFWFLAGEDRLADLTRPRPSG